MSPALRERIVATLALYGAGLTEDNYIVAPGGGTTRVQITAKGKRLRYTGLPLGNLLATGPASHPAYSVSDFVESFWFWKKVQQ